MAVPATLRGVEVIPTNGQAGCKVMELHTEDHWSYDIKVAAEPVSTRKGKEWALTVTGIYMGAELTSRGTEAGAAGEAMSTGGQGREDSDEVAKTRFEKPVVDVVEGVVVEAVNVEGTPSVAVVLPLNVEGTLSVVVVVVPLHVEGTSLAAEKRGSSRGRLQDPGSTAAWRPAQVACSKNPAVRRGQVATTQDSCDRRSVVGRTDQVRDVHRSHD